MTLLLLALAVILLVEWSCLSLAGRQTREEERG